MAGFQYRKSLVCGDDPVLLYFTIANSSTVSLGDAVRIDTDGFAIVASAGTDVLGVVSSVCDAKGLPVDPDSGTLDTFTVESDNETDKQYKVGVQVSKYDLFFNDASGTLAQTNIMQFFDLTNEHQINASSASDTAGQFQLVSIDPDADGDASKGIFRIAESQFDPYAQQ